LEGLLDPVEDAAVRKKFGTYLTVFGCVLLSSKQQILLGAVELIIEPLCLAWKVGFIFTVHN
jgi:hypothetical protein